MRKPFRQGDPCWESECREGIKYKLVAIPKVLGTGPVELLSAETYVCATHAIKIVESEKAIGKRTIIIIEEWE